jgi:hypothetical protein
MKDRMQRALLLVIGQVDVSAVLQQQLHHARVQLAASQEKRRVACQTKQHYYWFVTSTQECKLNDFTSLRGNGVNLTRVAQAANYLANLIRD